MGKPISSKAVYKSCTTLHYHSRARLDLFKSHADFARQCSMLAGQCFVIWWVLISPGSAKVESTSSENCLRQAKIPRYPYFWTDESWTKCAKGPLGGAPTVPSSRVAMHLRWPLGEETFSSIFRTIFDWEFSHHKRHPEHKMKYKFSVSWFAFIFAEALRILPELLWLVSISLSSGFSTLFFKACAAAVSS